MGAYRISYNDVAPDRTVSRVDCGTYTARTGLDAIRAALAAAGVAAADIAGAHAYGSNKRLVIAGITFRADREKNA